MIQLVRIAFSLGAVKQDRVQTILGQAGLHLSNPSGWGVLYKYIEPGLSFAAQQSAAIEQ
jgi:hypothetical protein